MRAALGRRSVLGAWSVVALLCHGLGTAQAQPSETGVKRFDNSIVRLPEGATSRVAALTNDARQSQMELHFALEASNLKELEQRVARGETVSPSEMKERYSGSKQNVSRLTSWLKEHGFEITQASPDFTSVFAKATVAKIEETLGVKIAQITYKGKTGPAATTPPALPRDVGEHVIAIDGLQPFIRAVKHTVPRAQYRRMHSEQGKPPVPRPATATEPTYKVKDILKAYNAKGLSSSGSGQVIAILIDTFPKSSDLKAFWQKNGLTVAQAQIELVNVQGAGTPLPAREGEETLDAEWASGIAPGATVRIYASGSLEYTYLDRALEQIYADALATPGVRQVSISLGLREDLVSPGEIQIEHELFVKLAAVGTTVFVSSGDAGSNPDETGHSRSPDSQVEYESSDPFTIAVGGTSLKLNRVNGSVVSETGWADSGGGVSKVFPRPAWQSQYAAISSPQRLVPDVSTVADPDPGAFVWLNGTEWPVGGTSWSTPVWAGFAALLNSARSKAGKAPLGFLGPVLYGLPPQAFRDIVSGSNGAYHAGAGWDPVTGRGVPDVKAVLQALP